MKLLLLSLLLSLVSCSLLQEKKDPLNQYIQSSVEEIAASTPEVEEALTQYGSMGAGTYKAKATLLTPVLLEMKEKEKPFSEAVTQKNIAEAKKKFTENKTCLKISLRVITQSKYAYFEEWSAKVFIEQSVNEKLEFPLVWTEESLTAKPQTKLASAFHGKTEHYSNEGVACTEKPIPLNKGFTLKLLPSFIQWPFDGTLDLSWNFVDPGAKPLKKIKETYRGW